MVKHCQCGRGTNVVKGRSISIRSRVANVFFLNGGFPKLLFLAQLAKFRHLHYLPRSCKLRVKIQAHFCIRFQLLHRPRCAGQTC